MEKFTRCGTQVKSMADIKNIAQRGYNTGYFVWLSLLVGLLFIILLSSQFSHLEWPTIYNLAKYFRFVRFLIYTINYILKIGIEFGKYRYLLHNNDRTQHIAHSIQHIAHSLKVQVRKSESKSPSPKVRVRKSEFKSLSPKV